MAASSSRSLTVGTPPQLGLPQVLNTLLGGVLELVIHSIESLRDRRDKLSMR